MSSLVSCMNAFAGVFTALAGIVNPINSALVFARLTAGLDHARRSALARRIALQSGALLIIAMIFGGHLLDALGIEIGALRVAGGLALSAMAWSLLGGPRLPAPASGAGEGSFFPLTMPMTVGPGSIATAIAVTRSFSEPTTPQVVGSVLAVAAISLGVGLAYAQIGCLAARLSPQLVQTATMLSAFLLLAIGISTGFAGIRDLLG